MSRVKTRMETIAQLHQRNVALKIPSYQRPYIWPTEDVTKLLMDVANARQDGQENYFIGTLISTLGNETAGSYELIDGQQRITTLVLLALAFREQLPDHRLVDMTRLGKKPRLTFAIREKAQAFLTHEAGLSDVRLTEEETCDPYVVHLHQGLKAARQKLKELAKDEEKLRALADYLYEQVVWVNNIMPAGINPNQLFTRINTSGVQLEQTDILKSQLLYKIHQHKRRYDAIWQACENLGNYFERNVRQLFPNANWQQLRFDSLAKFDAAQFPIEESNCVAIMGQTLAELTAHTKEEHQVRAPDNKNTHAPKDSADTEYCRSIISFPLLLMHTYRIFRAERKQGDISSRLHANNFGECFKSFVQEANEADAVAFIELLWHVRYQFDCWVVKWRQDDNDNTAHLYLGSVSWNDSEKRLNRSFPERVQDLVQLQAVRNFTGERSAQYWLTPLLARSLGTTSNEEALALLEDIDNKLSLANCSQKEASFALLQNEPPACHPHNWIREHLEQHLGTGFEHYWFQKLEYVLWKNRASLPFQDDKRLADFRISSKNSVEHVHPQHHEYTQEQLEKEMLNSFGNLALLSPGENSSYSNQDPGKKRVDFNKKPNIDALKLAHIFKLMGNSDVWDDDMIKQHREDMLKLLEAHYHKGRVRNVV